MAEPTLLTEMLGNEIARNRRLLEMYSNSPSAKVQAEILAFDLKTAEEALASGDPVAMLSAFNTLTQG